MVIEVCRISGLNSGLRKRQCCSPRSATKPGSFVRQLSEAGPASISALAHNFRSRGRPSPSIFGFWRCRHHPWKARRAGANLDAQPVPPGRSAALLEVIARGWDDALGRLKAHLEDGS